jgi:hypothetical protein
MVDNQKRFMDVYVGLLGSVNYNCIVATHVLKPIWIVLLSIAISRTFLIWLLGHKMECHLTCWETRVTH